MQVPETIIEMLKSQPKVTVEELTAKATDILEERQILTDCLVIMGSASMIPFHGILYDGTGFVAGN